MADKTSVNVTFLDYNGKKGSKAITDVKPTATDAQLKAFAVGLTALTTNTVSAVEKIERTDITAGGLPKLGLVLNPGMLDNFKNAFDGPVQAPFFAESATGDPMTDMSVQLFVTDMYETPGAVRNAVYVAATYFIEPNTQRNQLAIAADVSFEFQEQKAIKSIVADLIFAATETTSKTIWRLTLTPGDATFVQL